MKRRAKTQKQIDAYQDRTNTKQDLMDHYHTVTLVIYGVCLLGIFALTLYAAILK